MLRRDVGYVFDLWLQRAVVKDDGNPSAVVVPAGTHAVDHVANSSSLKPTKLEVLAGSKPNCALKNLETHRRKRVPDQQLADAWRNSLLESLASTRSMECGAYTESIWGLSLGFAGFKVYAWSPGLTDIFAVRVRLLQLSFPCRGPGAPSLS